MGQAAHSHGRASARLTQTAVGHVWVRTSLLQGAGAVAAVAQTSPDGRSAWLDAQGAQYVGVVPVWELEIDVTSDFIYTDVPILYKSLYEGDG